MAPVLSSLDELGLELVFSATVASVDVAPGSRSPSRSSLLTGAIEFETGVVVAAALVISSSNVVLAEVSLDCAPGSIDSSVTLRPLAPSTEVDSTGEVLISFESPEVDDESPSNLSQVSL